MKAWIEIEKVIFSNLRMIWDIARRDFKKELAGSKLGMFWAIVKPLSMILVFTFVYSVLKAMPIVTPDGYEVPFILWLISAYIPWMYMSDCITLGANSIRANSFLVKKVKFPIEILPPIRMVMNFFTFLILLVIGAIIFVVYGVVDPQVMDIIKGINPFLFIYFLVATILILSAIARLLSTWVVMSIDVMHAIGVVMQFLFWTVPVMWPYGMPMEGAMGVVMNIAKLNPLMYLVNGFRYSIFGSIGFNDLAPTLGYTIYFWVVTGLLFIFSSRVYKKLRPEFDDVL